MVGDAEQEVIHFVKEGTYSVRPSTVDVTSGCRKDGLAKDEVLLLRHPNGFGEGDLRNQEMHRELKDGHAVKSVNFPHPLTDDSPGVHQSLGGGTADTHMTDDEEQDRFKDTREVRGLYREISRIYGLDFWEELGRPESVHAPSFNHDTGHSDDQALVIMDKEALDHRLLTKSFLNYLS